MENINIIKDGHFTNRTLPLDFLSKFAIILIEIKLAMRPKIRPILEMCIDEGARIGYRRAYKHTEEPDESWVIETINNEIMNVIDLYFDFEE